MKNTQLPTLAKASSGSNGKMRAAHVGLRTTNYAATIGWYTEKLGFRVVKEWTVGNLQLAFLAPAHDDNFWLEVVGEEASDSTQNSSRPVVSGFHHLCLEVDNVEETLTTLREKGVQVIREPFTVPAIGKRCGFVTDLHGNVLEFAESIS